MFHHEVSSHVHEVFLVHKKEGYTNEHYEDVFDLVATAFYDKDMKCDYAFATEGLPKKFWGMGAKPNTVYMRVYMHFLDRKTAGDLKEMILDLGDDDDDENVDVFQVEAKPRWQAVHAREQFLQDAINPDYAFNRVEGDILGSMFPRRRRQRQWGVCPGLEFNAFVTDVCQGCPLTYTYMRENHPSFVGNNLQARRAAYWAGLVNDINIRNGWPEEGEEKEEVLENKA